MAKTSFAGLTFAFLLTLIFSFAAADAAVLRITSPEGVDLTLRVLRSFLFTCACIIYVQHVSMGWMKHTGLCTMYRSYPPANRFPRRFRKKALKPFFFFPKESGEDQAGEGSIISFFKDRITDLNVTAYLGIAASVNAIVAGVCSIIFDKKRIGTYILTSTSIATNIANLVWLCLKYIFPNDDNFTIENVMGMVTPDSIQDFIKNWTDSYRGPQFENVGTSTDDIVAMAQAERIARTYDANSILSNPEIGQRRVCNYEPLAKYVRGQGYTVNPQLSLLDTFRLLNSEQLPYFERVVCETFATFADFGVAYEYIAPLNSAMGKDVYNTPCIDIYRYFEHKAHRKGTRWMLDILEGRFSAYPGWEVGEDQAINHLDVVKACLSLVIFIVSCCALKWDTKSIKTAIAFNSYKQAISENINTATEYVDWFTRTTFDISFYPTHKYYDDIAKDVAAADELMDLSNMIFVRNVAKYYELRRLEQKLIQGSSALATSNSAEARVAGLAATRVPQIRSRLTEIWSAIRTQQTRFDPLVIYVWGQPRIGKTKWVQEWLIPTLADSMGISPTTYSMNFSGNNFFLPYYGEQFALFDEALGRGPNDPLVNFMNGMASSGAFNMEGASVECKTQPCAVQVIILLANPPTVNLASVLPHAHRAFWERCNHIKVEHNNWDPSKAVYEQEYSADFSHLKFTWEKRVWNHGKYNATNQVSEPMEAMHDYLMPIYHNKRVEFINRLRAKVAKDPLSMTVSPTVNAMSGKAVENQVISDEVVNGLLKPIETVPILNPGNTKKVAMKKIPPQPSAPPVVTSTGTIPVPPPVVKAAPIKVPPQPVATTPVTTVSKTTTPITTVAATAAIVSAIYTKPKTTSTVSTGSDPIPSMSFANSKKSKKAVDLSIPGIPIGTMSTVEGIIASDAFLPDYMKKGRGAQDQGRSKTHYVYHLYGRAGVGKTTAMMEIANELATVTGKSVVEINEDYVRTDIPRAAQIIVIDDWILTQPEKYLTLYNRLPDSCIVLITSNLSFWNSWSVQLGRYRSLYYPYIKRVPNLTHAFGPNTPEGVPRRAGFQTYRFNGQLYNQSPLGYAGELQARNMIPTGDFNLVTGHYDIQYRSHASAAEWIWQEYNEFLHRYSDIVIQEVETLPAVDEFAVECEFCDWDECRSILTNPANLITSITGDRAKVKVRPDAIPCTATTGSWQLPIDAIDEAEAGSADAIVRLLGTLRSFGANGPIRFTVGTQTWIGIGPTVYALEIPELVVDTVDHTDARLRLGDEYCTVSKKLLGNIVASGAVNLEYPEFKFCKAIRQNSEALRKHSDLRTEIDAATISVSHRRAAQRILEDSEANKQTLLNSVWSTRFLIIIGVLLSLLLSVWLIHSVISSLSGSSSSTEEKGASEQSEDYNDDTMYEVKRLDSKIRRNLEREAEFYDHTVPKQLSGKHIKNMQNRFSGLAYDQSGPASEQATNGLPGVQVNSVLMRTYNTLFRAYCTIHTEYGTVQGIVFKGRSIVAPCHVFGPKHDAVAACKFDGRIYKTRIVRYSISRDLIILEVIDNTFPPQRDIRKHFIKLGDLEKVYHSSLAQVIDGKSFVYRCQAHHRTQACIAGVSIKKDLFTTDFARISCLPTVRGSCGFAYVAENESLDCRRIFGLHVAGNSDSFTGYAAFVYQEFFDEGPCTEQSEDQSDAYITEDDQFVYTPDLRVVLSEPSADEEYPGCKTVKSLTRRHDPRFRKEKFKLCSWSKDLETITTAKHSIAFIRDLSDDTKILINGYGMKDIAYTQLHKYFGPSPPVNEDALNKAARQLKALLVGHYGAVNLEPVSLYEAINGDLHNRELTPYVGSIDLDTSSGFYGNYVLKKSKKSDLIRRNSYGFLEIVDSRFRAFLDDLTEQAYNGKRLCVPFLCSLKAELLPAEKAEAGRTRLFAAADCGEVILCRRIFLTLAARLHKFRRGSPIKIGIDPVTEFSDIRAELADVAAVGIEGDFSRYDKRLHPVVLKRVFDIVKSLYLNVYGGYIDWAYETFAHSLLAMGNSVVQAPRGNPSGHYLTCIINSLFHVLMNYYVIYLHGETPTKQNFACIVHGDDGLTVMNDKLREKISPTQFKESMENTGMIYKLAHDEFVPLEKLKFLKRSVALAGGCGNIVLPSLDPDSIVRTLHYASSNLPHDIVNRLNNALFEASLHDRDFYNAVLADCKLIIKNVGSEKVTQDVILVPYDQRRQVAVNLATGNSNVRTPPFSMQDEDADDYVICEEHALHPYNLRNHVDLPYFVDLESGKQLLNTLKQRPDYSYIFRALPQTNLRILGTEYCKSEKQIFVSIFHALRQFHASKVPDYNIKHKPFVIDRKSTTNVENMNNTAKLYTMAQQSNGFVDTQYVGTNDNGDHVIRIIYEDAEGEVTSSQGAGRNKKAAKEHASGKLYQLVFDGRDPSTKGSATRNCHSVDVKIEKAAEDDQWHLTTSRGDKLCFGNLTQLHRYLNGQDMEPKGIIQPRVTQQSGDESSSAIVGSTTAYPGAVDTVLNPNVVPNMLMLGGVMSDIKDTVYNVDQYTADSPVQISASATAGSELYSIKYGSSSFTKLMKYYLDCHERYAGAVCLSMSLSSPATYFGRILVGWVPDADKTYTAAEIMKFGYYHELDLTGRKDVKFVLGDARDGKFYRLVGDSSDTIAPGIKIVMATAINNSLGNDTAVANLLITSRFHETFQAALPTIPEASPDLAVGTLSNRLGAYGVPRLMTCGTYINPSAHMNRPENPCVSINLSDFTSADDADNINYEVKTNRAYGKMRKALLGAPFCIFYSLTSSSFAPENDITPEVPLTDVAVWTQTPVATVMDKVGEWHDIPIEGALSYRWGYVLGGMLTITDIEMKAADVEHLKEEMGKLDLYDPDVAMIKPAVNSWNSFSADEASPKLPNNWTRLCRSRINSTVTATSAALGFPVIADSYTDEWSLLQRSLSVEGAKAVDLVLRTKLSVGYVAVIRYFFDDDYWVINFGDNGDDEHNFAIFQHLPEDLYIASIQPRKINDSLPVSDISAWTSYMTKSSKVVVPPRSPRVEEQAAKIGTTTSPPRKPRVEEQAAAAVAGGVVSGIGKGIGAGAQMWWQGHQNNLDRKLAEELARLRNEGATGVANISADAGRDVAGINAGASVGSSAISGASNIISSLGGAMLNSAGRISVANIGRQASLDLADRNLRNRLISDAASNGAASRSVALSSQRGPSQRPAHATSEVGVNPRPSATNTTRDTQTDPETAEKATQVKASTSDQSTQIDSGNTLESAQQPQQGSAVAAKETNQSNLEATGGSWAPIGHKRS